MLQVLLSFAVSTSARVLTEERLDFGGYEDDNLIYAGDEVLVEVYFGEHQDQFLGYLQSCGDHAINERPHVCAYAPNKTMTLGTKYTDPATLGTLSFILPGSDETYACPCNYAGTITFMPKDDGAITDDDQAEWQMGWGGAQPLQYGKYFYPIVNKRWQQTLGMNPDDPPCRKDDGKYCMNLNDGRDVGFLIKNAVQECKATKVPGRWVYVFTVTGETTETWKIGTTKQHSESKTKSWSTSVTATVRDGWLLEDVLGGYVEISGTVAQSTSQTYSDMWSTSEEQTWSITFGADTISKAAWQFHFNPEDNCGHSEKTLVHEFALTDNAAQEPCCVPGYGADAPYYKTCISKDVMIPNPPAHCKVKPSA